MAYMIHIDSPSQGFVPHVEGHNTVRIAQSKPDYYSGIGQLEASLWIQHTRVLSHGDVIKRAFIP
jgi:hypothetical protein